ncbi:hypothetical protein ACHAXN_009015 [Cyclotella atomus]
MKSIIVHLLITLTIFTLTSGATRSEDCSDLSARRCIRTRGCEWGRDRCFAGSGDVDTNEQGGRCHHLSERRCTRTPG